MFPARAFACGKVILCGEHAVVYGVPAIALPVCSRGVSAEAVPAQDDLTLILADLGRRYRWVAVTDDGPMPAGFRAVLAAFERVYDVTVPHAEITLRSQLPLASGLGSGAALSTALLRVLLTLMGLGNDYTNANQVVYEAERIYHGTPSGIDNTTIVYEKPVYYQKGQEIRFLTLPHELHLLIGNTGQSGSTKPAVAAVRALYDADPPATQRVLQEIGVVTMRIKEALAVGDLEALGHSMSTNHTLLQTLTVSSPMLDALVKAAHEAGALGAKLSGGGRGGVMIALVTPARAQAVTDALLAGGATEVIPMQIGGETPPPG